MQRHYRTRPAGQRRYRPLIGAAIEAWPSSRAQDRSVHEWSVHEWYRFVLSFPPHLVQDYLDRFGMRPGNTVLDPFAGTGTNLVECKKRRIASVGIESNPMAQFASSVKVDWSADPDMLSDYASAVADRARAVITRDGYSDWNDLPLFAPETSPEPRCGILLLSKTSSC